MRNDRTILITGVTGQQGGAVARAARQRVPPSRPDANTVTGAAFTNFDRIKP
jgi:uncharacterized protein YbjT (DUF2867 family)